MSTNTPVTPSISAADRRFMQLAVDLGRAGWGRVQPNPMVGCVIVRDGEVVGHGWHEVFGGPHAEILALERAGEAAKGATAYVSLEPCSHEGKTPPCSAALLGAGVRRVVFGAKDPGPESGGGAADLQGAGIEVFGPALTPREARRENPGFFQLATDRPWVALKLAVSVDGRIASEPGVRTDISGPEANDRVQWLRAGFDAILVGTRTVLIDDPLLTVRGEVIPRLPPRRVILDADGKVDPGARVMSDGQDPVVVVTTRSSPKAWRSALERGGARVLQVEAGPALGVSLTETLGRLRAEEVRTLLCEGGGRLGAQLLSEGLVDRLYLIIAPKLIGPRGVPAFDWGQDESLECSVGEALGTTSGPLRDWVLSEEPRRLGRDVWMALEPKGV